MRSLRIILSLALAVYMTGAGRYALAQDADTSPFSITLQPLQYADVKGNVGKFEALNWMPSGGVEGVSDVSFVKDINKDISLSIDGSAFTDDNGTGHLTLKDGDKAFLQIDYNAFRKYFDGAGGDYPYVPTVTGATKTVPAQFQGAQSNSPDLQLDLSFLKVEAGLGPITDPDIDVVYEHDSKNGDKSLEQWESAYLGTGTSSTGQMKIAPSWESLNDTTDTVTLKEKKEVAGVTIKADQRVEVDYNQDTTYMQYLNDNTVGALNQLNTVNDSPDAKLFGAGIMLDKWMMNDNTYAAMGYHYNHTHSTDLEQGQVFETVAGVVTPVLNSSTTLWNYANALEDDHVWVGNLNTNLTHDLTFVADTRYEHMGSEGNSSYYTNSTGSILGQTASDTDNAYMQNHQDQTGEHVALQYSGIAHTSLYAESAFEQERNVADYIYTDQTNPAANDFTLDRIDRTQDESWTVGGRVVPNRFFIFSTQVKQYSNANIYDTVKSIGSTGDILLDAMKEKGVDETSTFTWRPYHWIQNSLKYQFTDTVYNPQEAEGATNGYPISENHMLSSQFTYDITVEPTDTILLMLSYSHVENYVRTLQASEPASATPTSNDYIPTFNSGDNSWLISGSYSPLDNLTWTSTACYTLSNNYVDFTSGIPLGSDFKELNFTTGFDWTFHKWLTIGPKYEYASYRDNPLEGDGNYSANIFLLTGKFSW